MTIDIYESIIVLLPQLHRMTALMKYRMDRQVLNIKNETRQQTTEYVSYHQTAGVYVNSNFYQQNKKEWYINRDLFRCLNIISDIFDIFYIFIRHMYRARSCALKFNKNAWKSAIYLSCFSFFVCITVRYYGNASTNLHCGNTIGGVLSASATNR